MDILFKIKVSATLHGLSLKHRQFKPWMRDLIVLYHVVHSWLLVSHGINWLLASCKYCKIFCFIGIGNYQTSWEINWVLDTHCILFSLNILIDRPDINEQWKQRCDNNGCGLDSWVFIQLLAQWVKSVEHFFNCNKINHFIQIIIFAGNYNILDLSSNTKKIASWKKTCTMSSPSFAKWCPSQGFGNIPTNFQAHWNSKIDPRSLYIQFWAVSFACTSGHVSETSSARVIWRVLCATWYLSGTRIARIHSCIIAWNRRSIRTHRKVI